MDEAQQNLLLKRPVTVKVIVTPKWQEEAQQQLQAQISQADKQVQQLEMQGQRAITELQKQATTPPGPQVSQQIDNVQIQVNQQKSQLLEKRINFSSKFSKFKHCKKAKRWFKHKWKVFSEWRKEII